MLQSQATSIEKQWISKNIFVAKFDALVDVKLLENAKKSKKYRIHNLKTTRDTGVE